MRTFALVVMSLVSLAAGGRAPQQPAREGIPFCTASAERNFQSNEAKQCWFKAVHGAWRILSRAGHYDTVVYEVGADDQDDALEIARAIVAGDGSPVGELLLYVYSEPLPKSARTRRIRWDAQHGYETLDFDGHVPKWVMPVQP